MTAGRDDILQLVNNNSPGEEELEPRYISRIVESESLFDFQNVKRNNILLAKTATSADAELAKTMMSRYKKTGTTICGCVCKDGVVMAADTRATMGNIVYEKDCDKLHKLAANIYCAGAGVSGDLHHVTRQLACETELMRMQLGGNRLPRVESIVTRAASRAWQYQGHIVCAIVVGGVDATGAHLRSISPEGYVSRAPFQCMGSGGYFAMSYMEKNYRDDLTLEEGIKLCADCIEAGVINDTGSGSHVDVVAISVENPANPTHLRHYREPIKHLRPQPIRGDEWKEHSTTTSVA